MVRVKTAMLALLPSLDLTACDLCTVGRFSPAGVSCDACADTVDALLGSLTVASHRMA